MSKFEKLIERVLSGRPVSYEDTEKLLFSLKFTMKSEGSHHVFRKKGYAKNISIKKRPQLFPYQLKDLKEVLKDHGYPQKE